MSTPLYKRGDFVRLKSHIDIIGVVTVCYEMAVYVIWPFSAYGASEEFAAAPTSFDDIESAYGPVLNVMSESAT